MKDLPSRILRVPTDDVAAGREFLQREWLLTNGLGGYASGTLGGNVSRRYHGLLIAALPAPVGRALLFNHLAESIVLPDGRRISLSSEGDDQPILPQEVRLEYQLPVWRYVVDGSVIEKRIVLINGQNTVHVTYEVIDGPSDLELELRPSFQFRPHEEDVDQADFNYDLLVRGRDFEIHGGVQFPPLRMTVHGENFAFDLDGGGTREVFYAHEAERGYHSLGRLWSPGVLVARIGRNCRVGLVASTASWSTIHAIRPEAAVRYELERRHHLLGHAGGDSLQPAEAEFVLAADQFLISPVGRVEDSVRARAAGDEVRTVIAGYHWFTDWGRDTMISLEGLTLCTGRFQEAGWILRTFAHHIRDGLIPNLFPEGESEGLYHTADATLWFFHALARYVETTGDRETLEKILPRLLDVIDAHEHGTHFGIGVDPADGLLRQGEENYQLTWMDAKVGDWVVTPRRGKAVEINALWYNALRLSAGWLRELGNTARADEIDQRSNRVHESFNKRFWNPEKAFLFDIVDGERGDDPACRPNQIFAIALPHPVLREEYWERVMSAVEKDLLTPFGLRSLSPDHRDYKPRYFGDLRARDAAYHQGTVWGWLIGPYVDAALKVRPDSRDQLRERLHSFIEHLDTGGLSSVSEIFDAEAPFTPRGCIAQAWSVAEVLRCLKKTAKTS